MRPEPSGEDPEVVLVGGAVGAAVGAGVGVGVGAAAATVMRAAVLAQAPESTGSSSEYLRQPMAETDAAPASAAAGAAVPVSVIVTTSPPMMASMRSPKPVSKNATVQSAAAISAAVSEQAMLVGLNQAGSALVSWALYREVSWPFTKFTVSVRVSEVLVPAVTLVSLHASVGRLAARRVGWFLAEDLVPLLSRVLSRS